MKSQLNQLYLESIQRTQEKFNDLARLSGGPLRDPLTPKNQAKIKASQARLRKMEAQPATPSACPCAPRTRQCNQDCAFCEAGRCMFSPNYAQSLESVQSLDATACKTQIQRPSIFESPRLAAKAKSLAMQILRCLFP